MRGPFSFLTLPRLPFPSSGVAPLFLEVLLPLRLDRWAPLFSEVPSTRVDLFVRGSVVAHEGRSMGTFIHGSVVAHDCGTFVLGSAIHKGGSIGTFVPGSVHDSGSLGTFIPESAMSVKPRAPLSLGVSSSVRVHLHSRECHP